MIFDCWGSEVLITNLDKSAVSISIIVNTNPKNPEKENMQRIIKNEKEKKGTL